MPATSSAVTLTVNTDTKIASWSANISLYETRAVTIVASDGDTWPSGTYTLALTYYGRTVALSACSWVAGALTCSLNLNTTELVNIFAALSVGRVTLDLSLWDAGNSMLWARCKTQVYKAEYSTATAAPTPVIAEYYHDTESLDADVGNATASVDLTSLSLTQAPVQVLVSVATPAGGDNIFATVAAVTATSITVNLSARVPATGYSLHWLIFP